MKDYKRMAACSYLLPDPGGEVVRELVDDVLALRARVEVLEGALRLSQEWADTMIDYCGRYLESHPANTDRYNPERFVRFMLESLDGPAQRKVYEVARAALAGGGKEGEDG